MFFVSLSMLSSAPLVGFSFLFFLLPLSVLISRRSPAHSILFALGQDKHCLCVTPKTFHRLSRFQHGPDISIIGFFLLWECFRESENGKKKKSGGKRVSNRRGAKERSVSISTRTPLKCLREAPQQLFLSCFFYYVEQKDQRGEPRHTKNRLNPS